MAKKFLIIVAVIVAFGLAAGWWLSNPDTGAPTTATGPESKGPIVSAMHGDEDRVAPTPPEDVIVPVFSPVAKSGQKVYEATCSVCHGINAAGTERGPPLIHNLYRPGHHSDAAFAQAAASGVVAHHWRYGNMPPIKGGVPETEMRWIVKYLRELQRANGVQ
ncbi:MAG: cytochrome c [Halocynthiibacter sp.]